MKTVIIGGGKGCISLLGLASGTFLRELVLEVIAVVDIDPMAPGLKMAEQMGIQTFTNYEDAFKMPGVEMVIELTGEDAVSEEIYKLAGRGMKVIDHTVARIFWDIHNARQEQEWQLKELNKLEKQLEDEKFFLQTIFDSSADLSVVLKRDQTILRANKKFCEFSGISEENLIGNQCSDVLINTEVECNKEEQEEAFNEVFRTGRPYTIIKKTQLPNETHWEITRTPVFNYKGKIEFILATWHRITERIKLKREIESAEQRFRSFIFSAQDWISIKDLEGKYVIVNPVIARSFKIPINEFIGKNPRELLDKKLAKTINAHDREVIETKRAHTYDEIIPIQGQDHHFQTVRFPLTDYKGEITGVCTIARDVTREMLLKDQLVQSEKLASLGKLAAGVAHEINNPLTGILAYAENLVEDCPKDDPHQQDFEVIIRETLRCRDIVRNLLDFAKQDKPFFQVIHPDEIVDQVLKLVKRLPQFKDIYIDVRKSNNVPLIESDPQQMLQVILNLMINAADAMGYKGEITVTTDYDRKSSRCMISVEDNGPGIPENLIDKIFEPFFSTKDTNGLGLAVSWGIVERHRGSIEIDMSETGGAIFRILLPAYFKDHEVTTGQEEALS